MSKTRVNVHFEGMAKKKYGYFDGINLYFSDALCTPATLIKQKGTIKTPNKEMSKKVKEAGYPVELLETPQDRWDRNNLSVFTVTIPKTEKAALLEYCQKRGISLHSAMREMIRKTIGLE